MRTLGDWLVLIGVAIAFAQLLYTAIPFHAARRAVAERDQTSSRRALIVMAALTLISCGSVGFDYFDRGKNARTALIHDYGVTYPSLIFMAVDGKDLSEYGPTKMIMMITRIVYGDVDRMKDKNIEKSILYTITPQQITLAKASMEHLKLYAEKPITFEFNLVVVPFLVNPDDIRSLSDVEAMSGQILDTQHLQTVLTGAPAPVFGCPQSPTAPAQPRKS